MSVPREKLPYLNIKFHILSVSEQILEQLEKQKREANQNLKSLNLQKNWNEMNRKKTSVPNHDLTNIKIPKNVGFCLNFWCV